jgi:thiol-disulfide isomerase/thioredoxin
MTDSRHSVRGWGLALGLALLPSALSSCGDDDRPVAEPNEIYVEPSVADVGGHRVVKNKAPRERIITYAKLPSRGPRPLFLGDAAATPLPNGGAAWPDTEGARVVLFDRHGVVSGVLQGAAPNGRRLAGPVSVAVDERGVLAVEPDGSALLFENRRPVAWLEPVLPGPIGGSSRAGSAGARTFMEFALAPVGAEEPLLWFVPPDGGLPRPLGSAKVPEKGMLGQLVNSGWAAVAPDGAIYFAPALESELRRFDADGELAWISRWPTPAPVPEPRFVAEAGSVSPKFTVVQRGLAVGPDGLVYVLASPRPGAEKRRLLAFDDRGQLVRWADVAAGGAVFADREGRIFRIPLDEALWRSPAPPREAFPSFTLPALGSEAVVNLESYRGRVVVVNFWASWCAPCRKEMPLLDAFAAELDPSEAVVLGLNEDVHRSDALKFLQGLGGVSYANAAGDGRLRDRYGYRGLPYTIVLDREQRIVRTFYGFGRSIDPIRDVVLSEVVSVAPPRGLSKGAPEPTLTSAAEAAKEDR